KAFFHLWRNFLDRDTWLKIAYGANEEVQGFAALSGVLWTALGGLGALFLLRLGEGRAYWRTLAFIVVAAAVCELASFQIWHVFPNLCGSRLLFIPSAFLCMALAMVALPAFRLVASKFESRKLAVVPQVAGAALLIVVGFVWINTLTNNLIPWTAAGEQ